LKTALAAGGAALAPAAAWAATPAAAGRYAAEMAALRAYAEKHVRDYGLPGLTLAVVDADGFERRMSFGYADPARRTPIAPQTLFQIGSISKSFVGLALFRKIEAGELSLDADARQLLPDVPWPEGQAITVQQLLCHSTGLAHDAPVFPRTPDGRLWVGFTPGGGWSYSNTGYTLLGMIAERLYARPLAEVLETEVLGPLGMTGSEGAILAEARGRFAQGYSPLQADRPFPQAGALAPAAWVDVTDGAGCVASTSADMARYLRFLIDAGRGRGGPLLSDASAARWVKPVIDAPGWAPGAAYANGLAVVELDGRKLLHHTGGMVAFSSSLHVDPEAGVGCFASSNVGGINYRPRHVTAFACELLRAARDKRKASKPAATVASVETPGDYAGRLVGADGETVEFVVAGGALSARVGGRTAVVEQQADDAFLIHDPRFAAGLFQFERDPSGAVIGGWHMNDAWRRPGAPAAPAPSPELKALTGFYETDDPWYGGLHIFVRGDELWNDLERLTKHADGWWRSAGDEASIERYRFEAVVAGRPKRLNISGRDFVRRGA
ncbi:serine hydrolase domain-containing protein, partial [Caulobacter sp. 17J65-9]|uniref:serine hydrolase domain-containing protein n=1 Tax=Caulobacter sp. 17J65-9 TaxID=2709382 RepID=UPI0013CB9A7C